MNQEKKGLKVVKWSLLLAAYAYLGYCLCRFQDYPALLSSLRQADIWQVLCLLLCVALMPVNIAIEACKWRTLLRHLYPMSFAEAQRQVYHGFVGAFVTPYRAGDFPARTLLMKDKSVWKEAIALGMYGSVVLTLVIILVGAMPAMVMLSGEEMQPLWWGVGLAMAVALLLVMFRHRQVWGGELPLLPVSLLSLLRYLCFAVQLYLMLQFVGVFLTAKEAVVAIPVYYLLVTLTPNMPAADAGIRGSWAIWVFSKYSSATPLIALAAVGLWAVNTLLPMLVGSVIKKQEVL